MMWFANMTTRPLLLDYAHMGLRVHSRVDVHVRCVESALGLGGHVVIGVVLGFTTQKQYQSVEFFPSGFCEGGVDVVGVVTPLVRGGAKVLHGDQVVELSVLLEVHEKEEEGEDGEGLIEVESERV